MGSEAEGASSARSHRILLLDDHAWSCIAIQIALATRGHICLACLSVADALEVVTTFKPDVVIYEWKLRTESTVGFPARARMLASSYAGQLLVMVASTCDEPADFVDRDDIDAYFTKPVLVAELEKGFAPAQLAAECADRR